MTRSVQVGAAAALIALTSFGSASSASAGAILRGVTSNGNATIETIFEFGNVPIAIQESSQFSVVRVIQFGGAGPSGATIIQNGSRNVAEVMQLGGTTDAAVGQSGASNMARITQFGENTNSLVAQGGNMNTGSVQQFNRFNFLAFLDFFRGL